MKTLIGALKSKTILVNTLIGSIPYVIDFLTGTDLIKNDPQLLQALLAAQVIANYVLRVITKKP